MRIESEMTFEEIMDDCERSMSYYRPARRRRWLHAAHVGIVIGLAVYIVFTVLAIWPGLSLSILHRLLIFGLVMLIGLAGESYLFAKSVAKAARELIGEMYEPGGTFQWIIELRDDCIWTLLGSQEGYYPWTDVEKLIDGHDAIEFRMADGNRWRIGNKEFSGPDHRQAFLNLAKERMGRPSQ